MNELMYTIDGCMVHSQPKPEIAKIFAKSFNYHVLVIVKDFWSKNFENLKVNKFIYFQNIIKIIVY